MFAPNRRRSFRPFVEGLSLRLAPSGGMTCPMDPVLVSDSGGRPAIDTNPMDPVLVTSGAAPMQPARS